MRQFLTMRLIPGIFLVTCAWAQNPKVYLTDNIIDGAKQAQGSYETLPPGVAPDLSVYVSKDGITFIPTAASFSVDLQQRTFSIAMKESFEEKESVRVEMRDVNQKFPMATSQTVRVKPMPPATKVDILSVDAIYGAASVTVRFTAVDTPIIGTPSIRLRACHTDSLVLFDFNRVVTTKEMAAGSAKVDLPTALINKSGENELQFTISGKTWPIFNAVVKLNPLHEGDKAITGSAGPSVARVCIAIFAEGHEPVAMGVSRPTSCRNVHSRLASAFRAAAVWAAKEQAGAKIEGENTHGTAEKSNKDEQTYDRLVAGLPTELREREFGEKNGKPELDSTNLAMNAIDYGGPLLDEEEVDVDSKLHTYSLPLANGISANSMVFVREVFTGAPEGELVAFDGPAPVTVDATGFDLGRVRAFLTMGASLSESSNSFGQADPYMCFKVDGTFYSRLIQHNFAKQSFMKDLTKLPLSDAKHYNDPKYDVFGKTKWGTSIHWTASIALNQTGTVSTDLMSLSASQSTMFQAGLYAPFRARGMDWTYRGLQYSAYVAPIVKLGATVVKGGVAVGMTTTKTSTSLTGCTAANCTLSPGPVVTYADSKGPAPFAAYGFRVGVMKYTILGNVIRNRQIASDPVIYMDFTLGKNQVYPTPGAISSVTTKTTVDSSATTTTTTTTQSFDFKTRVAIEARIKLPYLPAELGADLNFNWKNPVRGNANAPSGDPTSPINYTDFRIILGLRFDVAKAMSTLLGAGKAAK